MPHNDYHHVPSARRHLPLSLCRFDRHALRPVHCLPIPYLVNFLLTTCPPMTLTTSFRPAVLSFISRGYFACHTVRFAHHFSGQLLLYALARIDRQYDLSARLFIPFRLCRLACEALFSSTAALFNSLVTSCLAMTIITYLMPVLSYHFTHDLTCSVYPPPPILMHAISRVDRHHETLTRCSFADFPLAPYL